MFALDTFAPARVFRPVCISWQRFPPFAFTAAFEFFGINMYRFLVSRISSSVRTGFRGNGSL
jgi:hypothetical protein